MHDANQHVVIIRYDIRMISANKGLLPGCAYYRYSTPPLMVRFVYDHWKNYWDSGIP